MDDWTLLVVLLMVTKNRFWSPIKKAWLLDGDRNPFSITIRLATRIWKGACNVLSKIFRQMLVFTTKGDLKFCCNDEIVIVDDQTKFWLLNYGWLITFGCFTYGNQIFWSQLKPSFINKPHFYFITINV